MSLTCEGIVNRPEGVRVQVDTIDMTYWITLAEAAALSDALAKSVQEFGRQQVNLQYDYLVSTDASFGSGAAVGAIHVFGRRVGTWVKRFKCETCLHAELETIQFALEHVKKCSRVTIYTDSEQAVNLLTKYSTVKEPIAAGIVAAIRQRAIDKRLEVIYTWKSREPPEIQRVHGIGQRAGL